MRAAVRELLVSRELFDTLASVLPRHIPGIDRVLPHPGERVPVPTPLKVSFFGIEAAGGNVVFVVDKSSSMLGPRMRRAKGELIRAIGEVHGGLKFNVLFFEDGRFEQMTKANELVSAPRDQKEAAKQFVARVAPGGGTNPLPALKRALAFKDTAMILLLSDGEFFMSDKDFARLVRECRQRTIMIHTIAFEDNAGEGMLKKIAKATGAQYKFVR